MKFLFFILILSAGCSGLPKKDPVKYSENTNKDKQISFVGGQFIWETVEK